MLRIALAFAACIAISGCDATTHVDAPLAVDVPLATNVYVLPNGLVVLEQPDRRASLATVRVRYHVGSKDDPTGQSGLAHVVQHLMDASSRRTSPGDYRERARELTNGEPFTNNGRDDTDYGATVAPADLAVALWLEADRMAFPFQPAGSDQLREQKARIADEARRSFDADATAWVRDVARREVFGGGHPYATTTQGEPEQIQSITLEDARQLANRYYRPDNATLVVAGAFDPATARPLLIEYFSKVPAGAGTPRLSRPRATIDKSRTVTIEGRTKDRVLVVAWVGPTPRGDGYSELTLAAPALRDHAAWSLQVAHHVVDEVRFGIEPGQLGSLITATMKLADGTTFDDALAALDRELAMFSQLGRTFEWEDFAAVKLAYASKRILALEGTAERARRLVDDLEYRGRSDGLRAELREVQDVRAADVGTAVAQFLRESPRIVVMAERGTTASSPGRAP